jgi:NADH-quinone oxidoreductase subunit F
MSARINLEEIKESYLFKKSIVKRRIIVCAGTGCVANGSLKVFEKFKTQIQENNLQVLIDVVLQEESADVVHLSHSGCQGFCQMGALVTIEPDDILYVRVKPDDVSEIISETLIGGKLVDRLLYHDPNSGKHCKGQKDITFYNRQKRTVLKSCGVINPDDINEYISIGGYASAEKAYLEMQPGEICKEIMASGLRGRGGGGFPTGKKWDLTRIRESSRKFIICNGDEGDPGAFMDRSVMEGNPHSVLEGMLIAARAIGASEGFIYVRAEYPLAVQRMKKAVKDAESNGVLGKEIFGTGHDFVVVVMEGAGAFVCGEETALIASIQGNRGMPSPKPPFPAEKGLWGFPTVINNVETLATIPLIMQKGAAHFNKIGTPNSPGTKTFALTGHVANTGLIEVPFGSTLREIIFNIGGGVTVHGNICDESAFKAVQIGGPSGGCLTSEHLDLPLDFDSLRSIGAMVGSGGLVVMNQDTCMVQMAKFFMQFTQNESCGKCVLCREGTKQMLALLEDITEGRANAATLSLLEQLAKAVSKGSLCGLGKTAPNPILSMLKSFKAEFEAHVYEQKCPSKRCKALLNPYIDPAKCKGCGVCLKKCPTGAITGAKRLVHVIDDSKCIKCGACIEACKLDAVA